VPMPPLTGLPGCRWPQLFGADTEAGDCHQSRTGRGFCCRPPVPAVEGGGTIKTVYWIDVGQGRACFLANAGANGGGELWRVVVVLVVERCRMPRNWAGVFLGRATSGRRCGGWIRAHRRPNR